jgi:hypothetical protein
MKNKFFELYKTNKPISTQDKEELVGKFSNDICFDPLFTKDELNPSDFASILEVYGTFWVTIDNDNSNKKKPHAVIVCDITRVEKEKAEIKYLDVFDGKIKQTNFTDFITKVRNGNDKLDSCVIRRIESVNESGGSLPTNYSILDNEIVYIYIAGYHYPEKHNSFSQSCVEHFKLKVPKVKESLIVLFDFKKAISFYKFKNNTFKKIAETDFLTISKKNYKRNDNPFEFDFLEANGYLSKNDVINFINNLKPGQISSLNIFSHSILQSQIFLNTYEIKSKPNYYSEDSNYQDMDFRIHDVKNIQNNKFSNNTEIKFWGCSYYYFFSNLIIQMKKNNSFSLGSDSNSDTLEFNFTNDKVPKSGNFIFDEINDVFIRLMTGYNFDTFKTLDESNSKISLLNIKKVFSIYYSLSFSAEFSKNSNNNKVIAALPGTGANFKGNTFYMKNTDVVRFYKNVLGLDTNENYGIFDSKNLSLINSILNQ